MANYIEALKNKILITAYTKLNPFEITVVVFVQNQPSPMAVFSKPSISNGTFITNILNLIEALILFIRLIDAF